MKWTSKRKREGCEIYTRMPRREHGETSVGPITGYGIIQDERRSSSSQKFLLLTAQLAKLTFFFFESLDPLCHLVRQPAASVFPEVPLV